MMDTAYNDWTVLETPKGNKCLCRCKCGVQRLVNKSDLRTGRSKGCGCEGAKRRRSAALAVVRTHGMDGTPTYQSWVDMRRRCNNPERPDYHRYGGRGIKVCPEWDASFEAFFRDMGVRPEGKTLDRIDNEADYALGNCKWSTRKEQGRNTRKNRIVTVDGITSTFIEACERHGIKAATAHNRDNLGWSIDDVFKRPLTNRGQH